MSEWFKELVLKTSDPARDQGFESLSLRHLIADFLIALYMRFKIFYIKIYFNC